MKEEFAHLILLSGNHQFNGRMYRLWAICLVSAALSTASCGMLLPSLGNSNLRLGHFSWKSCGTSSDPIQISSLTLTPDPISVSRKCRPWSFPMVVLKKGVEPDSSGTVEFGKSFGVNWAKLGLEENCELKAWFLATLRRFTQIPSQTSAKCCLRHSRRMTVNFHSFMLTRPRKFFYIRTYRNTAYTWIWVITYRYVATMLTQCS